MSEPSANRPDSDYGTDYLQRRLDRDFPLARHIGVRAESADDRGVVLRAPFAPNANYKGTAFGGSLFSLAVLAGWAWATRYLAVRQIDADVVIQESTIRYLAPARGELRAALEAPAAAQKFHHMLERAGRGRIRLQVGVFDGKTLATQFDGHYVALIRQEPGRTPCPED
jgi:thioesterase domain-containing protein